MASPLSVRSGNPQGTAQHACHAPLKTLPRLPSVSVHRAGTTVKQALARFSPYKVPETKPPLSVVATSTRSSRVWSGGTVPMLEYLPTTEIRPRRPQCAPGPMIEFWRPPASRANVMPPKSGAGAAAARVFATVSGRQGTDAEGAGTAPVAIVRARFRHHFSSHPPDVPRIYSAANLA